MNIGSATDAALREGAQSVCNTLKESGFDAYFAGGCVRDLLLGFAPKDYDIVTNARPEQVQSIFRRTVAVGAAFGVIVVLLGKREYEVATYRSEGSYSDGRRPDEVVYGDSPELDVQRRDFTINALLMESDTFEVLDFVDGRRDLKAGLIRAVGNAEERFSEDRLRMLRAVRFAARYGFELEPATRAAIEAREGDLKGVSVERVLAELEGLFACLRPGSGLSLLRATGLLPSAMPSMLHATERDVERWQVDLNRLQSALLHSEESPSTLPWLLDSPAFELSWSVELQRSLCWALGFVAAPISQVESAFVALKASKERTRGVTGLLRDFRLVNKADSWSSPSVMRLVADGAPEKVWALAALHEEAGGPVQEKLEAAAADQQQRPLPERPLLDGKQLLQMGIKPGPHMGELLRALDDAVLERRVFSRKEADAFVQHWLTEDADS